MKRKIQILLILVIVGSTLSKVKNTKMIIRLARHGARSPTSGDKFGIGWPGIEKDYDFGELIPSGYRQHYISGVELTLKYRNLFMKKLEPEEYYLRSSAKERTWSSLFAHFMAFDATVFPKDDLEYKDKKKVPHNVHFPTIHTVPFESDDLIRLHGYAPCVQFFKSSSEEKKQMWKTMTLTPAFVKLKNYLKSYLKKKSDKLANFKKLEKKGKLDDALWFKGVSNLGDFGLADRRFRQDWFFKDLYSENLDTSIWEKIRLVNYGKHLSQFYNLYMTRTIVSPFLIHLREEFSKKIESIKKFKEEIKSGNLNAQETYKMKMRSYMSHDTFVTPMMLILGLIDQDCVLQETTELVNKNCVSKPPVASAFVWELNEKQENGESKFYINATYRGKYFNICRLKQNETDEEYSCPFEKFTTFINTESFSNWLHICEKYSSHDPEHFDYHKYHQLSYTKDDLWNGLCKTGLKFAIVTLLFVVTMLWMCLQIFRYGMLNSQLMRAYTQLKDSGDIDEDSMDKSSNDMFEMGVDKVKNN